MFSDTHCHIFSKYEQVFDLPALLSQLSEEKFRFVLDIGTVAGDLQERRQRARRSCVAIPDFVHFSAGVWPDAESIHNPENALALLEKDILDELNSGAEFFAVGECGLDRYRNGPNAVVGEDGKMVGTTDVKAEEAFFEAQIGMAKKYGLPLIIHSRDAAEDTIKCFDKKNYQNGVIHCYSYGIDEVEEFLKRGWYISFSGTCTFPKTNVKKQAMADLIKTVPYDKLLLETDAPFLTPAPHRGKTNTPLYVKHTYELVAGVLDISVEELCLQVFENASTLFKVR